MPLLRESPTSFPLLLPKASLSKDQNPKIGILKLGKSRRVLVLISFEVPVVTMGESLPEVGDRSLNLNLNNHVLQEVTVTLDLSKVPLIRRSTGSFPSQLEVLGCCSFCHQDPGIWTSASSRFSWNSFVQGSPYEQPLLFSREECCTLPSSLRYVAQGSNSGGQGSFTEPKPKKLPSALLQ